MKITLRNTIITLLAIGVFVVASWYVGYSLNALGNVTVTTPTSTNMLEKFIFFATSTYAYAGSTATTTKATSTDIIPYFDSNGRKDNGYFVIAGAKKVSFYFTRDGSTTTPTGGTRFEVETSPNGTDWYDFYQLRLSTSTTDSVVSSVTWKQPTTTIPVSMDLTDEGFYAVRCIVINNVDGRSACMATAEF